MINTYPFRSSTVYQYKATKCENPYNSRESHTFKQQIKNLDTEWWLLRISKNG